MAAAARVRQTEEDDDFVLDVVMQTGRILREGSDKLSRALKEHHEHEIIARYEELTRAKLIGELKAKFPQHKFISKYDRQDLTDSPTWMIEPMDGPRNFSQGVPPYTITCALAVHKQLEMGIVYNPALLQIFKARREHGAFLNGQKINIGDKQDLPPIGHFIPNEKLKIHADRVRANADKLLKGIKSGPITASVSLMLCEVACGALQSYKADKIQLWSSAGGILIAREAGAKVTNIAGDDFDILRDTDIICYGIKRHENSTNSDHQL